MTVPINASSSNGPAIILDLPLGRLVSSEIAQAIDVLTRFINDRAEATEDRLGFGFIPIPDAPDNYDGVRDHYRRSLRTGDPLPVSDAHSASTLFGSAETNYKLRFIHDVQHVEKGANFTIPQELEMARTHLRDLEAFGVPLGSIASRLLHADLAGQVMCAALVGDYPENQLRFDLNVVELGLDDALIIENEIQRGIA